ncbi:MAG: PHP domain-containing protein [Candidatus Omnitrophica bacterium]|nr:PHP domain-containing protein [Candidatus Omnitrophota bacterium]
MLINRVSNDRCDLHIHSKFSDSDLEVEDIFKQAKEKGLRCIAITDHDTCEGIPEARINSKKYDIELIEAFELSAQHKDVEVHILGYFVDSDNLEFRKELDEVKISRRNRLIEMTEVLASLGLKVDPKELMSMVGDIVPTRLHLALYLLNKGIVSSLYEAFRKYLSPGKPAYRARFKHSVADAVNLIKKHQGLSFLAHPHIITRQDWVEEFLSLGIDGLEVAYSSMSPAKKLMYGNLVKKLGLLRSGGSDAHGSYKQFTKIGKITIPYQWVEEMKARREALKT